MMEEPLDDERISLNPSAVCNETCPFGPSPVSLQLHCRVAWSNRVLDTGSKLDTGRSHQNSGHVCGSTPTQTAEKNPSVRPRLAIVSPTGVERGVRATAVPCGSCGAAAARRRGAAAVGRHMGAGFDKALPVPAAAAAAAVPTDAVVKGRSGDSGSWGDSADADGRSAACCDASVTTSDISGAACQTTAQGTTRGMSEFL